jgi:hypothetical protein
MMFFLSLHNSMWVTAVPGNNKYSLSLLISYTTGGRQSLCLYKRLLTTVFCICDLHSEWVVASSVTSMVQVCSPQFCIFGLNSQWVVASSVTSMVQVCSPQCSASVISTASEWWLLLSHLWSKFAHHSVLHLWSLQQVSGGSFFCHSYGPSLLTTVFCICDLYSLWVVASSSHLWSKFAHHSVLHLWSPQRVSSAFFCHIYGPNLLTTVFCVFLLHRKWVVASCIIFFSSFVVSHISIYSL